MCPISMIKKGLCLDDESSMRKKNPSRQLVTALQNTSQVYDFVVVFIYRHQRMDYNKVVLAIICL